MKLTFVLFVGVDIGDIYRALYSLLTKHDIAGQY